MFRQDDEEEEYELNDNQYEGFDEDLLMDIPEEDLIINIPGEDIQVNVSEDEGRSQVDVDRVVGILNRVARNDIRELEKIGIDRRLLNYFIRTAVGYIDRNYNRYNGTIEQKINTVAGDLRRDLNWMFEIMQIFGAPLATVTRLIDGTARVSFQNLRQIQPAATPRK
jgi:hypothetical protein